VLNEGIGSLVAMKEGKEGLASETETETALERVCRQVCVVRGLDFEDVLGDLSGMD
jgi:hypothetical protein